MPKEKKKKKKKIKTLEQLYKEIQIKGYLRALERGDMLAPGWHEDARL